MMTPHKTLAVAPSGGGAQLQLCKYETSKTEEYFNNNKIIDFMRYFILQTHTFSPHSLLKPYF